MLDSTSTMFDLRLGGESMKEPTSPSAEELEIALIGKALSNPVRVQMLRFLGKQGSYCGDLTEHFGLAQSTVSHHLPRPQGGRADPRRRARDCHLL